jgi:hypothetical protein
MPPENEPSLKDSLEAAYDSTPEESAGAPVTPVEPSETVVEELVVDAGPEKEPAPAEAFEPPEEPEAGGGEGDAGSDVSASDEEKKQEVVGEPAKEEAPLKANLRPPSGWKPAMREKFGELPEDVQREVLRREVDIAKGMEIAADARKFKQEFDQKCAPYQAEMASRNVTAMDAFDNYLSTAYKLRHAPPQEKAQLVGGLIHQYGIDIGMLDEVLTNQIQNPQIPRTSGNGVDPTIQHAISTALAPYTQFMENQQQNVIRTAEQTQLEVKEEVRLFKENADNEFYDDVKDDMANLLEASAMRSQNMTLQEAYDRAILLRPDLAEIVSRRKLQNEAQARDTAAQAAKAKAVGVTGSSPDIGGGRAQPQSLRGAIEAAVDSNSLE